MFHYDWDAEAVSYKQVDRSFPKWCIIFTFVTVWLNYCFQHGHIWSCMTKRWLEWPKVKGKKQGQLRNNRGKTLMMVNYWNLLQSHKKEEKTGPLKKDVKALQSKANKKQLKIKTRLHWIHLLTWQCMLTVKFKMVKEEHLHQ